MYVAEGIEKGLFFTLDSMRDLSTDVRHAESPRQSEMKSALQKQWHGRHCLKCMLGEYHSSHAIKGAKQKGTVLSLISATRDQRNPVTFNLRL